MQELAGLERLDVLLEHSGQGQGVCQYYSPCLVLGECSARPGSMVSMRPQGVEAGRIVGFLAEGQTEAQVVWPPTFLKGPQA